MFGYCYSLQTINGMTRTTRHNFNKLKEDNNWVSVSSPVGANYYNSDFDLVGRVVFDYQACQFNYFLLL